MKVGALAISSLLYLIIQNQAYFTYMSSFLGSVRRANIGVVWFKGNDLRVLDNPVLLQAHRECRSVNHIFCLDPRNFRTTRLGYEKTSLKRLAFLVDSLKDLKLSFEEKGSGLDVFIGRTEDVIGNYCNMILAPEIPSASSKNNVYCFDEVAWEEKTLIDAVASGLKQMRSSFQVISKEFWGGGTLLQPSDLPFDVTKKLEFFTSFRRAVESKNLITPDNLSVSPTWPENSVGVKPCRPISMSAASQPLEFACLDDIMFLWTRLRALGSVEVENYGEGSVAGCRSVGIPSIPTPAVGGLKSTEATLNLGTSSIETDLLPDPRSAIPFTNLRLPRDSSLKDSTSAAHSLGGGERAAHRRMEHYITQGRGRLSIYKETRNGMLGSDYSSKLSVYLALGNISARQILREIKMFERVSGIADENTYWLIFGIHTFLFVILFIDY